MKAVKISCISYLLITSAQTQAALYQVIEVTPDTSYSYESAYGVAIQPSTVTGESDNCFESSYVEGDGISCSAYTLAGETRLVEPSEGKAVDGLSYREETPFGIDNRFMYVQEQGDFEDYCDAQLLYGTCESWAALHWAQWSDELSGSTEPNSIAFLGDYDTGTAYNESYNIVINSLTEDAEPVGILHDLGNVTSYLRNYTQALDDTNPITDSYLQSRAWKTDGDYTVGSVSTSASNDYGDFYSSKAALWSSSLGSLVELDWASSVSDTAVYKNRTAQGSLRDFVIVDNTLYSVGYNTYLHDSYYYFMEATVFSVDLDSDVFDADNWETKKISGAGVESDDDYIYSNTLLNGVNSNLVAIGESKRSGSYPYENAASNRMYVVDDISENSLSATYLSGGIFFDGVGGKARAINNFNEIVGQVDAENTNESSGKPRRKRGFIYPYDGEGTSDTRSARFSDQAWWLDDLTNGGDYSDDNNQYRIIDASGINDAGVISATALKCESGYDDTSHFATCGDEDEDEQVVAVKLVPIVGATADDIEERSDEAEETTTSRSGGSLNYFGLLILLALFGYRTFANRSSLRTRTQ
ncbi:DUF3466 family protein [Vibrio natriegens]|uniref:DUF3466 family protein n=1 Tax=Vibrio natriegens TaxID=691 RepID=UPI001EFCBB82|nr:DUF3466 family protein [Vibrio natriegens]MCG9698868.1 DUF3466 family protein [Vibrio natriegens]